MHISKSEARKFLLIKHGLYGKKIFKREEGIMAFLRQAGCIQFDPIDVCGKNPELVLQSRIEGYKNEQLSKLLYEDRRLIDYWDKNMAIFPVEDWPYMERRRVHSGKSHRIITEVQEAALRLKEHILQHGPICSSDLDSGEKVDWAWAPTSVNRAALEALFFMGELGIHHKKNTKRYYDRIENLIPEEILSRKDPNHTEGDFYRWFVYRRLGSMGLLSEKNSDGLLGILGLKSPERQTAIKELLEAGRILSLEVREANNLYYMRAEDLPLLEEIMNGRYQKSQRMEFIAPLDNLIWDRKMIADIFEFDYKWEIYTPEKERKFGYYVLPILYGERFFGRIELIRNRKEKKLELKGLWWEPGVRETEGLRKKLGQTLDRFGEFLDIEVEAEWEKKIR